MTLSVDESWQKVDVWVGGCMDGFTNCTDAGKHSHFQHYVIRKTKKVKRPQGRFAEMSVIASTSISAHDN